MLFKVTLRVVEVGLVIENEAPFGPFKVEGKLKVSTLGIRPSLEVMLTVWELPIWVNVKEEVLRLKALIEEINNVRARTLNAKTANDFVFICN